jgi:hypothetical protein
MNPEENILCMSWDENSEYQKDNTRLTKELVNFFFEREAKHIKIFQGKSWCPKIVNIDYKERRIFIEWNKNTLNHIIFTGQNLNSICPNWQEQMFAIVKDIYTAGYYKMAMYPHCFYLDNDGVIKTFDFYSCVAKEEKYIKRETIEGMIGPKSGNRFNDATIDGLVYFDIFFKNTMLTHLATTWPENPFPDYYRRLTDE